MATDASTVHIDLYSGDEVVERLVFREGEDYAAEIYDPEFRLEVVKIE